MNKTLLIIIILGIVGLFIYSLFIFKIIEIKPQNSPQAQVNISPTPSPVKKAKNQELKIEDIKVGTGKEVKSGDKIVIHYKGTLTNGKQFDSSYDRGKPFETQIGVGQVIEGWDKGVIGMKVGGKRKLTIPPDMAYGNKQVGAIPPNSTLIFEVELINIK